MSFVAYFFWNTVYIVHTADTFKSIVILEMLQVHISITAVHLAWVIMAAQ